MKKFYQFLTEQTPEQEGLNATNILYPSFLMCPPFNLYADNHVEAGIDKVASLLYN